MDEELSYSDYTNLSKALRSNEFHQMFNEYLDEITDPKNEKEYLDYLKSLEMKNEVPSNRVLLYLEYAFCVKTHVKFKNGNKQSFYLNFCVPSKLKDFVKGISFNSRSEVAIPHIVGPPRAAKEQSSGVHCLVSEIAIHESSVPAIKRQPKLLNVLIAQIAKSMTEYFKSHEEVSADYQLYTESCLFPPRPLSVVTDPGYNEPVSSSEPESVSVPDSVTPYELNQMQKTNGLTGNQENDNSLNHITEVPVKQNQESFKHRIVEVCPFDIGGLQSENACTSVKVIFSLPDAVDSAKALDIYFDEKLLVLSGLPNNEKLTVSLAKYDLDEDSAEAKFSKSKHEMTVEIKVKPEKVVRVVEAFPVEEIEEIEEQQPKKEEPAVVEIFPETVKPAGDLPVLGIQAAASDPVVEEVTQISEQSSSILTPTVKSAPLEPYFLQDDKISLNQTSQNVIIVIDNAVSDDELVNLVSKENGRFLAVGFPDGGQACIRFTGEVDSKKCHAEIFKESKTMVVCRKKDFSIWKTVGVLLAQMEDSQISKDEMVPPQISTEEAAKEQISAVAIEPEESSLDFSGLEMYCHFIPLKNPWLYNLF
jgi:PIH1 N-terminal domain